MHKLHTIIKKAGISLLTAFTVFTNTNMAALIAKAAEPSLSEGEELYQVSDDEQTYSIRAYTSDESEVLFALRPDNTFTADDQYAAYADDGVDTYLGDNDITEDQLSAIKKVISIGYGVEPNDGNFIASQILIWQIMTEKSYDVDENVAANMVAIQDRIAKYDSDPTFANQEITFDSFGEDHAITLEDESFFDYSLKEIPNGYHIETGDGSLKLWVDEEAESGTLTFERPGMGTKSILYSGSGGDYLSFKGTTKSFELPVTIAIPEETVVEDATEAKGVSPKKAAKAASVNESVGDVRLIDISDVHVDYLKTGTTTMTEGETYETTSSSQSFSGRIEWKIPNSVDLKNIERVTYQLPKNVELTELAGDVTYKGEVVGTYEIDDNNMLYISYNQDFKEESDRSGWFKFTTESVSNTSEEQTLVFESGEEYSFKLKDPDPPQPVTPKIGVKKTFTRIQDGDAATIYNNVNMDQQFANHYTATVYTKDGENNNVVVTDDYSILSGSASYNVLGGAYRITITNNGETKYNSNFFSLSRRTINTSSSTTSDALKKLAELEGTYIYHWGGTNSDYSVAMGLSSSKTSSFPTVVIDHLNSGDVVTIEYLVNDNYGSTQEYGSKIKNSATVTSDENPEAPGTGNIFPEYSSSNGLTQVSETEKYNDAYKLLDKEATSEEDTVHVTITVNKEKELQKFFGNINAILNTTFDTTTNLSSNASLEPSSDADYYLDKDSIEVEVTQLVPANGTYERQTLWSSKTSGYTYNPNTIYAATHGIAPLSVFVPSTYLNQLTGAGVFTPVITIKYDLKLNPEKVQYSTCSTVEYQGSNTISTTNDLFKDDTGEIQRFSKTVNYKNTLIPPHVEKTFDRIYSGIPGSYDTFLAWNIAIYVPDTGLTDMVVTDIPSKAFTFYNELNTGTAWIVEDQTVHENPLTLTVTTDEYGQQKGEIKIDGRVEPGSGNYIHLNLAFKPGDYTLDPNYVELENGEPGSISFTNDVDMDADEIITPCIKCPTCEGGECTKTVKTANVVNKTYKDHVDNTATGGDLVIKWNIQSDISAYLTSSDTLSFEDYATTDNMIFNEQTLNSTVYITNHMGHASKNADTDFSDSDESIRFSNLFNVSHDGDKTIFTVKPEYIDTIKGKVISFDYYTTATKVSTGSNMNYENHVDMLVNNEKVSESEDDVDIKADKDNSFSKEVINVSDFFSDINNPSVQNLLNNLSPAFGYHPIDSDADSSKNVVVWKMEVDASKLAIDENTQSITIMDIFPRNVPSYINQDVFGVGVIVKPSEASSSNFYYAPITDSGLKSSSLNYLTPFKINIELNSDLSYYPNITATISNDRYYPNLKTALVGSSNPSAVPGKIYMYLFADYTPKDNLGNAARTATIHNEAELYIDGQKKSTTFNDHDITVEPPIKKSVEYDKDMAPYAEYTLKISLNEYSHGHYSSNDYRLFIEDIPANNLEILRESVTITYDVNSSISDTANKTIDFSYDEPSDRWVAVFGSDRRYIDSGYLDVSVNDGKLAINFDYSHPTVTYSTPYVSPGSTLTIKYKAKINGLEGETINARNEASFKIGTQGNTYTTYTYLSGTIFGEAFSKSGYILTDIFKKDAKTSDALEGAEFRIDKLTLNEELTNIVKTETFGNTFETSSNGHTDTVKLNYDTVYRLVETVVPDGYPDSNKITKYVVFPGHDNIDWANVSVDGIDYIQVIDPTIIDADNRVSQATVEVTNTKETSKKIILTKKNEKGDILPNAVFSLTGSDGSYTEYRTDEHGQLEITNLVRGVTYTLEEKEAPEFYNKNENVITFAISDKGEITSSSIHKYNVNFDGGKGTVTLDDETSDSVTKEIDSGEAITAMPDANAPEGYHFVGWTDTAGNIVDSNTVVDQNLYVTAKYEKDVHAVTFRIDDGTMSYRENLNVNEFNRIVPHGNTLQTMPSVKPASGYKKLIGWFDENDNEVTEETVVNDDMVVTAKIGSYMMEPGPDFTAKIPLDTKHVVFGKKEAFEAFINGVEGFNVDVDDAGMIKAYSVGDTLYVLSDETIYFNPDSSQMFSMDWNGKLESIHFANIDTSLVTNMSDMFAGQEFLTSVNLSGFDTRNVTDMSYMFNYNAIESLDLSNFDTSSVTNMSGMFLQAYRLQNLDMSGWNTGNVTDMSYMFSGTVLPELDVSGFDTSNVTDMSYMFEFSRDLKKLDVSNFNTTNVTNMEHMFEWLNLLEELDLSNWNTTNNPNRKNIFYGTTGLSTIRLGENWTAVSNSGFSTESWTQLPSLATKTGDSLMSQYTSSNAGKWILGKASLLNAGSSINSRIATYDPEVIIFGTLADYESQLSGATEFTVSASNDVKGYYKLRTNGNVNQRTVYILSDNKIFLNANSSYMFYNLRSLHQVIFSNVDASLVTNASRMFYIDEPSVVLTVTGFEKLDLSSLTSTMRMFYNAAYYIDISNIDTSKLTSYTYMFLNSKGKVIVKSQDDIDFYRLRASASTVTFEIAE